MDLEIKKLTVGGLRTNCYLVFKKNEGLIVDPGDDATLIIQELEKVPGINLKYLLLTHGHFDHVLAVDDLTDKYPHLSVLIHEDDIKLLRDTIGQGIFIGQKLPKVTSEVVAVSNDASIPFGDGTIKVIHTPGHTKGSVCYRIEDMLFTGDTIFYHTYGRTDLPWSEPSKIKSSIDKILLLPDSIKILPGHGIASTVAEERKFNLSGDNKYF